MEIQDEKKQNLLTSSEQQKKWLIKFYDNKFYDKTDRKVVKLKWYKNYGATDIYTDIDKTWYQRNGMIVFCSDLICENRISCGINYTCV